jgi:hypothetical protein
MPSDEYSGSSVSGFDFGPPRFAAFFTGAFFAGFFFAMIGPPFQSRNPMIVTNLYVVFFFGFFFIIETATLTACKSSCSLKAR